MARQVLPLVGAVAGFAIGGPTGAQIGFALGSLVGNAVDPIEMQGRKLGDSPTQVAAEGGARAIVYGKGCIRATCIIERGGRRVIKQRDRSGGKGGGPTTINERALWTFAIGLGEPVAAILRIWENEKLVYDVTPESTIPDDTAEFGQRFRFYTGAEDQLPDPALEALHGVGNTPYYRGTAYLVFPQYDLTDFGETVPTYRVEAATAIQIERPPTVFLAKNAIDNGGVIQSSSDAQNFDQDIDTGLGLTVNSIHSAGGFLFVFNGVSAGRVSKDGGETWETITGINASGSGVNDIACTGGEIPVWVMVYQSGSIISRSLNGNDFTDVNVPSRSRFCVAARGGRILVGGTNRSIEISEDAGVSFDGYTLPLDGSGSATLGVKSICRTDTGFVAATTTDGRIAYSTSGLEGSWEYRSHPLTGGYDIGLGHSAGITVACANTQSARSLNDGYDWASAGTTVPRTEQAVVPSNSAGFYVSSSIGTGPVLSSSQDAAAWEGSSTVGYSSNVAAIDAVGFTAIGEPVPLSSVISSLHERCGAEDYDVSELSELISGVVIESTSTAAEAINSIVGSHFADPSDYDGEIHYIKRGKPVVLTLTEDDLIDEPDEAQRNNAIEYPKKVHFLGQRADLAYASSKSTSARYSDDARVVGEITIGSPETYDDGTAPAEVAVKLHKVLWTEAEGEREWLIPDNYLGLVPTDNVGLSYRGELVRCRILNIEDTPGQRKLRMIRDRQSAYTANLTEIPNPPSPTPPQSSVVAPTVMAFIDTSALTDNADTLHYLVALSGANDNWAGAVLQQQLTGEFQSIDSTTLNSIMGVLQNTVTDAAPWYTDTTNTVVVRLYTDDELESRTDAEFLSNGGAFFLSWEDSGATQWEIMQFRDAVQDSNGDWVLSHLMRGRKNTETAEHPPGSMFVWIDPAILREAAQTSWLNTVLTHRAVSNGQSPELAPIQTNEYVGNSQREWPVANLLLSRPDADTVSAEAIPRHRFGTSMNPIRSVNWEGYRWVATDGSNTINRDGTSATETFDTTGWGSPVTVTVAQLNRLTGAGPTVSEEIV